MNTHVAVVFMAGRHKGGHDDLGKIYDNLS